MHQSHFEINVALRGKHFFATAERSCTTRDKATEVFRELQKRFPAEEGYTVAARWVSFITTETEL